MQQQLLGLGFDWVCQGAKVPCFNRSGESRTEDHRLAVSKLQHLQEEEGGEPLNVVMKAFSKKLENQPQLVKSVLSYCCGTYIHTFTALCINTSCAKLMLRPTQDRCAEDDNQNWSGNSLRT